MNYRFSRLHFTMLWLIIYCPTHLKPQQATQRLENGRGNRVLPLVRGNDRSIVSVSTLQELFFPFMLSGFLSSSPSLSSLHLLAYWLGHKIGFREQPINGLEERFDGKTEPVIGQMNEKQEMNCRSYRLPIFGSNIEPQDLSVNS